MAVALLGALAAAAEKGGSMEDDDACVEDPSNALLFPFADFFADAPPPLFGGTDYAADAAAAAGCFRHIQKIFDELDECRAFELLRSGYDRGNFLLTKHARVIAITCTHAAIKRRDLLALGFQYDNLVIEEAA